MTRALPRLEPVPVAAAPRKRRGLKVFATALAVVLVLAAAGGLARLWVMQQYYVGVDDNRVTIFQGVRGDVLGLPLHEVVEHSDLTINDLTESDLSAVTNGIVSTNGLDGAHNLVSMLNDRKLKPCPVISSTVAPTTAPAPVPAPAPAPNPAAPKPAAPPTTVATTPLPQATGIPGVTCRAG